MSDLPLVINICVCTFKRPDLLRTCLLSLANMSLPQNDHFFITVIDNDEEQSAQKTFEEVADQLPLSCFYSVAAKKGIPCARNRAVEVSIERKADYLIFIDDDETVDTGWLESLIDFSKNNNPEAVVHGKVIPKLPENVDSALQALFKENKRLTGDKLTACATDNVLIPMHLFSEMALRFDESRPLAGGTDTIFFTQATQRGVEIIQCNEAIVYETIPPVRTTLKWWMKRKYRAGLTDAWRKRQKGKSKVRIAVSASVQMAVTSLVIVISVLVFNKKTRNRSLLKIAKAYGVFMGVFGAEVDSY